jgi:hypothetical protein
MSYFWTGPCFNSIGPIDAVQIGSSVTIVW